MNAKDLEIIRRTSLFGKLPEQELLDILGNQPPHNYPKGKILFQQGDDADRFFVILAGWVKIYRQMPTGEEAVLHVFTKGETFAEAALFNGHRYPATAEVVSDVRLLSINCNYFEKKLRSSPRVAMNMLASTATHMKHLVSEIEQIKGRTSTQRLAFFLLEICPDDTLSAVVKLPYEKCLVASRLGIQPESLSRLLNRLRGFGITCTKDKIIISDVNVLRNLAYNKEV